MIASLLLAGALAGATPAATPTVELPRPPEPAVWTEPKPLEVQTEVEVDACERGPADDSEIGRFRAERTPAGNVELRGWVAHNGVEHIDAARTAAWQVGRRVVVSYRLAEKPFPEAPFLMCEAFSRVRITVSGLEALPLQVSVYEGRLAFSEATQVTVD